MKRITTLAFTLLITLSGLIPQLLMAQNSDYMSYQSVVRDLDGNLVANQDVGIQISIYQGSVDDPPVYVETHSVITNANGLITLEIGGGMVVSGDYGSIDWANDPYFLKTETDPEGGSD